MSILSIGLSVYDISVSLEDELVIDEKYRVSDRYECCGGQASNAACVCAKWGIETYMLSRIGSDTSGKAILDAYHQIGMKSDCVKVLENYTTCSSVIINHTLLGKRTILNRQDKIDEIDFSFPENVDYLLFDAHEEKASLKALQKYPQAIKMLDGERANKLTLQLAKEVEYLIVSERFAKEYTGLDVNENNYEEVIMKIKELNQKKVVVTLGDRGLIYEEDKKVKHKNAFDVKVVDTTGAGDIFHGALLYAITKKMDWEDALSFASLASALSVQKKGGFLSIPTVEEMMEAWTRYKKRE